MKFFNLLKKELRETFSTNMVVSLVVTFVLLVVLGQAMQSNVDSISESYSSVAVCDLDGTDLTRAVVQGLEGLGYSVETVVATDSTDDVSILSQTDSSNVLVFPEGFTESIESGEVATIRDVGRVGSGSIVEQLNGSTYSNAVYDVSDVVRDVLVQEGSSYTQQDMEFLDAPVALDEVAVSGDRSAHVSASTVSSTVSSQGVLVPLIVFMVVVLASQTIVVAVSNEKIDKTLETLLSTPVSRLSILFAKMLSAGIVALVSTVVYTVGFSVSMGSALSSTDAVADTASTTLSVQLAMESLGIALSPLDYVLVGIDVFLSIMVALSLSMVLGVTVEDAKSAQTAMMPVLVLVMVPYLVTYLVDVDTLSPVFKVLLNVVPFTHTFNATNLLTFGSTSKVVLGILYQVAVLAVCMWFTVRLFQSDRVLTASFNLRKRTKKASE